MSVRNPEWVRRYTTSIARIHGNIGRLEFLVNALPAPDDDGELPTLHYGHVGSVIEIARQLEDLVEAMRQVIVTER